MLLAWGKEKADSFLTVCKIRKGKAPLSSDVTTSIVVVWLRLIAKRRNEGWNDAVSDWPLLNLMANTAAAQPGYRFIMAGSRIGYSQHAAWWWWPRDQTCGRLSATGTA